MIQIYFAGVKDGGAPKRDAEAWSAEGRGLGRVCPHQCVGQGGILPENCTWKSVHFGAFLVSFVYFRGQKDTLTVTTVFFQWEQSLPRPPGIDPSGKNHWLYKINWFFLAFMQSITWKSDRFCWSESKRCICSDSATPEIFLKNSQNYCARETKWYGENFYISMLPEPTNAIWNTNIMNVLHWP